jgi:hypothetical protein
MPHGRQSLKGCRADTAHPIRIHIVGGEGGVPALQLREGCGEQLKAQAQLDKDKRALIIIDAGPMAGTVNIGHIATGAPTVGVAADCVEMKRAGGDDERW